VEETFVNLELIQQGLATTKNTDPLLSCVELFKNAEQSAREAKRGIWKIAPEP
jgi:endonuclease YncB( thermonuclease family)